MQVAKKEKGPALNLEDQRGIFLFMFLIAAAVFMFLIAAAMKM